MGEIIAGDARSISCDHDELGQLVVYQKSGEDANIDRGGYRSTSDNANITAGLVRIDVQNAKTWTFETTIGAEPGVYDKLMELSSAKEGIWTVIFNDGTVRAGSGKPTDDIVESKQAGTINLKLEGSGIFEEV